MLKTAQKISDLFPSPQGGSETPRTNGRWRSWMAFPSPQGGSETHSMLSRTSLDFKFPSPQGGSETNDELLRAVKAFAFPSPQGGSETSIGPPMRFGGSLVSIPSRRVGDRHRDANEPYGERRFHPLKAGRRRSHLQSESVALPSFHPLKAGRRPHHPQDEPPATSSFHPLKAGRRLWFAWRLRSFVVVSIPSRRVGDNGCAKNQGNP